MQVDLAVRGGTVYDGTGSPGRRGRRRHQRWPHRGDRTNRRGDREIDASGRVVAPGLVDIHTHYDPQVLWDGTLPFVLARRHLASWPATAATAWLPPSWRRRASLVRTLDKVEDMRVATLEAGVDWDFE